MAAGNPLPQVPPVANDAKDLAGPVWQRWFSLISGAIKSLITADQLNQFAGGLNGVGCYTSPVRGAGIMYATGNSPRFVSVQLGLSSGGDGAWLEIGGTVVGKQAIGIANACTVSICAIVPAGTQYQLVTQGAPTINGWGEL